MTQKLTPFEAHVDAHLTESRLWAVKKFNDPERYQIIRWRDEHGGIYSIKHECDCQREAEAMGNLMRDNAASVAALKAFAEAEPTDDMRLATRLFDEGDLDALDEARAYILAGIEEDGR